MRFHLSVLYFEYFLYLRAELFTGVKISTVVSMAVTPCRQLVTNVSPNLVSHVIIS